MIVSIEKYRTLALSRKQRLYAGFTLIELLVVIGIIILLASVGAVAAIEVRKKGRDTGIIANLSQVRTEAAVIYSRSEVYNNPLDALCDASNTLNDGANTNLGAIEDEVRKHIPSGVNPNNYPECYADTDRYCVQFPLNLGGTYCLDSTGYAGKVANCTIANIRCSP
jgi:type II secretory pathway pseudopilin PulG